MIRTCVIASCWSCLFTFVGDPARATDVDLRFREIRPTVFFRRSERGLEQLPRITVTADQACANTAVRIRVGGESVVRSLEGISAGKHTRDVMLRDIRERVPVTFQLLQNNRVQDTKTIAWQPQRHWTLHMVHGSHHDLGYTDLPSNVLRQHDDYLDRVLDYCDQTDDWPEDARFRYAVEQAWSVLHYVQAQPAEKVERLKRRLREGRIEVTALFGNETTELCGNEQQIRLLYPSFRLKRRFGIPITTAELNDIPGVSWGMVPVLAGSRVLYWHTGGGISGPCGFRDTSQVERDLPRALARIADQGYAFDLLRGKFHGEPRDNAAPNLQLSRIVRQWNQRWAYPRLIVSTNGMATIRCKLR